MGKKYIIELLDECNSEFKGIMVFGLTQEKQISVELIPEESLRPYTEPDLDAVRKEAYDKGYETAKHECEDCNANAVKIADDKAHEAYQKGYENGFIAGHLKAEKSGQKFYEDGYQRGLADAWEAARKIWQSDNYLRIFKVPMRMDCFTKFSASECIEKIRQYKQEKEEQVHVGDEVIPHHITADSVPVIVTRKWKDDYEQDAIDTIGYDGTINSFLTEHVKKTGKHFEIAEVLKKMKESE